MDKGTIYKTSAKYLCMSNELVMDGVTISLKSACFKINLHFEGLINNFRSSWNCLLLFFFDHHIKHVNTKLSKFIGTLYKIYKYLSINTLKLLYHTFIQPLSYRIEALYNADKAYTNNVFMMQKKQLDW